jgi:hypothetical protein
VRRIREPLRAAVGASVSVAERGAPPHYTVKRTQQAPRARRGPCRGRAARATARERVCRHTQVTARGTRHTLVSSEHKVHVDLPSSEGGAAPRGRTRRGPAPVACAGAMFHVTSSCYLNVVSDSQRSARVLMTSSQVKSS